MGRGVLPRSVYQSRFNKPNIWRSKDMFVCEMKYGSTSFCFFFAIEGIKGERVRGKESWRRKDLIYKPDEQRLLLHAEKRAILDDRLTIETTSTNPHAFRAH